MKYGIKTFWLDEAEPERHVQDIDIRYGYHDGTDAEIGLAWSRAEQQMVYEGLKAEGHQEDDIFMLSRSFFVGGAKYGAGAWSGDIPSTFQSFHEQVRVGQNVAVSGIHWWTNHMYIMDPFNPDTRAYVFQQLKDNYMKYGIKTFWLDEAEPERHVQDIDIRYGYHDGTDAEIGLAWSRAEQQMVYEGLKAEGHQEDDIFMLSRSFFVGGAKYGAGAWSGDIPSTFQSFHEQVRVGQNVAVSGIHWWTTDIGGYSGGSIDDPVMQELLIRWFQFGAFCPLFRLHGDRAPETITECGRSGAPVEVWHYGDDAYKSITAIMKFRESLRPYVSATMKVANQTGVPALRPLFLEFPHDQGLWQQGAKVDGQFMFGPEYLVAPVTEYNATSWQVYLPELPEDAKWVHHYTSTAYSGGQVVDIDVSDLDTFPLFKRSDVSLVDATLIA